MRFMKEKVATLSKLTLLIAFVSVTLNSIAQICLRKSVLNLPVSSRGQTGLLIWVSDLAYNIILNIWFIGGMLCYAASIMTWLVVLSKTEVSAAYPLLSIGYIIAAAIGFLFLGENVTLLRVAGILVICLGVVIISKSA